MGVGAAGAPVEDEVDVVDVLGERLDAEEVDARARAARVEAADAGDPVLVDVGVAKVGAASERALELLPRAVKPIASTSAGDAASTFLASSGPRCAPSAASTASGRSAPSARRKSHSIFFRVRDGTWAIGRYLRVR